MLSNSNQPINYNQNPAYNYNAIQQQPHYNYYQSNNFQQGGGYPANNHQNYIALGQNENNLGLSQQIRINKHVLKRICVSVLIQSIVLAFFSGVYIFLFFLLRLDTYYPSLILGINIMELIVSIIFMNASSKNDLSSTEVKIAKVFVFYIPVALYLGLMIYSLVKIFLFMKEEQQHSLHIYWVTIVFVALALAVRFKTIWSIQAEALRLRSRKF